MTTAYHVTILTPVQALAGALSFAQVPGMIQSHMSSAYLELDAPLQLDNPLNFSEGLDDGESPRNWYHDDVQTVYYTDGGGNKKILSGLALEDSRRIVRAAPIFDRYVGCGTPVDEDSSPSLYPWYKRLKTPEMNGGGAEYFRHCLATLRRVVSIHDLVPGLSAAYAFGLRNSNTLVLNRADALVALASSVFSAERKEADVPATRRLSGVPEPTAQGLLSEIESALKAFALSGRLVLLPPGAFDVRSVEFRKASTILRGDKSAPLLARVDPNAEYGIHYSDGRAFTPWMLVNHVDDIGIGSESSATRKSDTDAPYLGVITGVFPKNVKPRVVDF